MKALKYIIVTSFLILAFKFLLALNAVMNGSYHASQASHMVPFLFILALSTALYLIVFTIRKAVPAKAASPGSKAAEDTAGAQPPNAAQAIVREAVWERPAEAAPAARAVESTAAPAGEVAARNPDSAMLRFFPNRAGKTASTPGTPPVLTGLEGSQADPGGAMRRFFPMQAESAMAAPGGVDTPGGAGRALSHLTPGAPATVLAIPAAPATSPIGTGTTEGSPDHADRADLAGQPMDARSEFEALEQKKQALQLRQEIRRLEMKEGVAQRAAGLGRLRWRVAAPLGLLGVLFLVAGGDSGSLLLGGFGGLMLLPAVLKACGIK